MPLSPATIQALADHLEAAELKAHDVVKITDEHPEMDFADAYAIQYAIRANKLARGVKLSGLKMGLTSFAKMKQMGVDVPIYGFLADYFARPDGAAIAVKELIHPKIEAEIAFVTKAALHGPGCHIGDVLAATDFVIPAVEVIDSRYRDFKFDLKSVVADNCSSARYVTGASRAASTRSTCARWASSSRRTARSSAPPPAPRCWAIRRPAWRCWPTCWPSAASTFPPAPS